jgi:hypothetical protein
VSTTILSADSLVEVKPAAIAQRWPADRFYWAVIEAPTGQACKRDGPLPAALLPDLADQVPMRVDELHGVCARCGDGRIVVCAAAKSELAEIDAAVVSLMPDAVPLELAGTGIDPASLNLLCGAFEPRRLRRARVRRGVSVLATFLAVLVLVAMGASRRIAHARAVGEQSEAASARLLAALGPRGVTGPQLQTELNNLRQSAGFDLSQRRSRDAAAALQVLLSGWPVAVSAKPQSIAVGSDAIVLSVLAAGDPSAFVQAFKAPEGWKLEEPSLTKLDAQTRISLRLRPAIAGGDRP